MRRPDVKEGGAMAGLKPEVDAAEVGLDPARLERLDRHFARYVDDGRLPGWLITVSRYGRLAHVSRCGSRDIEAGLEVESDTLWRIYSMTKPVTSVAAMMLYEEGAFELTDPVSAFIPSFAQVRVHTGGPDLRPVTVPATEPVRIWHLLTHTAGLSYGFHRVHPVDAMYRAAGFDWAPPEMGLAQACDVWAGIPLLFEPGSEWNYSVATDVLGRVIEVVTGQRLDAFLAARILRPLGMADTSFSVDDDDAARLAALYTPGADGTAVRLDALGNAARKPPAMLTIFPAASIWTRSAGRSTPSSRSAGSASASGSPWSPTRWRARWSAPPASFPGAVRPAPRSGSTRRSS